MSGLKVSGDKSAYTSNYTFETTSVDPDGKNHKMSGTGVQKLHMVKEGGKWLYSRQELVSSTMMMNGKALKPTH